MRGIADRLSKHARSKGRSFPHGRDDGRLRVSTTMLDAHTHAEGSEFTDRPRRGQRAAPRLSQARQARHDALSTPINPQLPQPACPSGSAQASVGGMGETGLVMKAAPSRK
jgi:hypothetical protein